MEDETKLTAFERDLLESALHDWPDLLAQLDHCCVKERGHTGGGAMVKLSVSKKAKLCLGSPRIINTLDLLEIDGLENGAGFLVHVENGHLDCLEQFAYGEEYPKKIDEYQILKSTSAPRY